MRAQDVKLKYLLIMSNPISIYLIDDHKIFSQSFEAYVSTQPDFIWKGSSDGSEHTLKNIMQINPKVVLMDFHLKGVNGLELLKQLKEKGFKGHVIMLTMNRDHHTRMNAKTMGANGFVSKDSDGEELLQDIKKLINKEIDYLELLHTGSEIRYNVYHLTRQEKLIAELVCSGLNSEDIAKKLNISIHTVHTHRRRILEKTSSTTFIEVCNKLT